MINKLLKEREEDFEKEFPLVVAYKSTVLKEKIIDFDYHEETRKAIKSHNKQTNKLLIEKVIEMCEGEKKTQKEYEYCYDHNGEQDTCVVEVPIDCEHNQALDQIITQLRKEI